MHSDARNNWIAPVMYANLSGSKFKVVHLVDAPPFLTCSCPHITAQHEQAAPARNSRTDTRHNIVPNKSKWCIRATMRFCVCVRVHTAWPSRDAQCNMGVKDPPHTHKQIRTGQKLKQITMNYSWHLDHSTLHTHVLSMCVLVLLALPSFWLVFIPVPGQGLIEKLYLFIYVPTFGHLYPNYWLSNQAIIHCICLIFTFYFQSRLLFTCTSHSHTLVQ